MADLGQIFTKKSVARYMVSLFDLPPDASIMEPCCGAGSLLQALTADGFSKVCACEIDKCLQTECQNRFPQFCIFHQDFLKYEGTEMYDGIIMNPPYIRQEKIDTLEQFGITKRALRTRPIFQHLSNRANMYMYFVIKAIDLLKTNGQLIVIFPSSWMKAKSAQRFQALLSEKCKLQRQIHIFGDVFEKEALVDVVILKLIKGGTGGNPAVENLVVKNGRFYPAPSKDRQERAFFKHPFSKLASARRGLTTGCNKMYINPRIPGAPPSCLKPILSSPKSIKGFSTDGARLDFLLSSANGVPSNEVIRYLDFWKKKITAEKKPKTLYQKILHEKRWHELHEPCTQGIIFSYLVRNDMKFVMNETGVLVRDNFYIIAPHINPWLMFALLNNYYTYYQLELCGKRYGAGLLKLQRYDLENLTFPAPSEISEPDQKDMVRLSRKLIEENDQTTIDTITQYLSKYSIISYNEITKKYFSIKKKRLEAETYYEH